MQQQSEVNLMDRDEKEKYIKDNKEKLMNEMVLAKIDILQCKPIKFLEGEIFRQDPIFTAGLACPTAGANGKDIMIDPEFWDKLKRKQKFRAIYHEGFHNLMGHCDVRVNTETDRLLWNIAVDCVTEALASVCQVGEGNYSEGTINPTSNGTVNLDINGKQFLVSECDKKSAEEIYNQLHRHIKKFPGKGKGHLPVIRDDNGKVVLPMDNHDLREHSPEEKAERDNRLRRALNEHKLRGTMPGGLADMIEEMLKGKVNWKAEIREAIQPLIRSKQSYRRPSRRGSGMEFIRPSRFKDGVEVYIAEDTSGSIGKEEINYFNGEVQNLFKQFTPGSVKAHVMFHTTGVYETIELSDVKDLAKVQTQSGGTDHCDVFAKAEEAKARVLVCFTDGYSGFPETTNIKRILWICTSEDGMKQIPDHLGKKIFVDPKEFKEE
jgi:predicted metal-dependent peptidase